MNYIVHRKINAMSGRLLLMTRDGRSLRYNVIIRFGDVGINNTVALFLFVTKLLSSRSLNPLVKDLKPCYNEGNNGVLTEVEMIQIRQYVLR